MFGGRGARSGELGAAERAWRCGEKIGVSVFETAVCCFLFCCVFVFFVSSPDYDDTTLYCCENMKTDANMERLNFLLHGADLESRRLSPS